MGMFKRINSFTGASVQLARLLAAVITVAVVVTITLGASGQTPKSISKKTEETTTTATVKAEPLSGAQLWAMNCSRCHMARNPGEFTAGQWRTIFRHMRVRANLPASQAKEIQKYLEAGAGK